MGLVMEVSSLEVVIAAMHHLMRSEILWHIALATLHKVSQKPSQPASRHVVNSLLGQKVKRGWHAPTLTCFGYSLMWRQRPSTKAGSRLSSGRGACRTVQ